VRNCQQLKVVSLLAVTLSCGLSIVTAKEALLPTVPDSLADPHRSELNNTRSGLQSRLDKLNQRIENFNTNCNSVEALKADLCREEQKGIRTKKTELMGDIDKFKTQLRAAAVAESSPPPLKSGDVPRNLAHDPVAARLSQVRLDQVEARMARLQKAIDVLSYTANPDWERAWNDLVSDMRKNADEQFQLGCDGLSAGLAQALELSTAHNVKLAKQAVDLPAWKNLSDERGQLEHLISSSVLLKGPAGDSLRKTVEAIGRLESARTAQDTSQALSITRDAVFLIVEGHGQAKSVSDDPSIANALYRGSAMVGATASVFASAAVKEATAPVDVVFKLGEAGLLLRESREEDEQFATLSKNSYDRHQSQMELEKEMGKVQEERTRLKWAVEKAR
jgi:hypothetical protein